MSTVLRLWEQTVSLTHAKSAFIINNYSNWTLPAPSHRFKHGTSTQNSPAVHPGSKEAWFAKQSTGDGWGVEVTTAWSRITTIEETLFIYIEVACNSFSRKPNSLAVGFVSKDNTKYLKEPFNLTKRVKSSSKLEYMNIIYKEYDKVLQPSQSCNKYICVQVAMTPTYEAQITISVYPLKVDDLAPSVKDKISQRDLNNVLHKESHTVLGGASTVAPYVEMFVFSLVVIWMILI